VGLSYYRSESCKLGLHSARGFVACTISFLTEFFFFLELVSHFRVSSRVLARLKAGRSENFLPYAAIPGESSGNSTTRHESPIRLPLRSLHDVARNKNNTCSRVEFNSFVSQNHPSLCSAQGPRCQVLYVGRLPRQCNKLSRRIIRFTARSVVSDCCPNLG
jgi:hypothetical protein